MEDEEEDKFEDSPGIDPQVIAALSSIKRRSSSRAFRRFSGLMGLSPGSTDEDEEFKQSERQDRGEASSKKARLLQEMKAEIELLSGEIKNCEQVQYVFTRAFTSLMHKFLSCSSNV